jgi:hypothetical protein
MGFVDFSKKILLNISFFYSTTPKSQAEKTKGTAPERWHNTCALAGSTLHSK